MSRFLLLTTALGLSACMGPAGSGTAVGNPPSALLRTASSAAIELAEAEVQGAFLEITPCDAREPVSTLELGDVDLVEAPEFTLPAVQPCGATLLADRMELEAFEDTVHELEIEVMSVEIDLGPTLQTLSSGQPLTGAHILELGQPDWLVDLRDPVSEEDVIITPDDPRHALLQQALGGESALWRDRDESAEVEDPERDMPVLAAWEEAVEPR